MRGLRRDTTSWGMAAEQRRRAEPLAGGKVAVLPRRGAHTAWLNASSGAGLSPGHGETIQGES